MINQSYDIRFLIIIPLLFLCIPAAPICAAITGTGGVTPANPVSWSSSTTAYVGETTSGSVTVDSGSDLLSAYAYIGYSAGYMGKVTVDGAGSTWINSYDISVGLSGNGTLNVTGGGNVSNSTGSIGIYSGSTGVVTVDGTNSKWTNSTNLYVGRSGNGTLKITGGGNVSGQYYDGQFIYSIYIGSNSGSTGFVSVDGSNSKWTNGGILYVGSSGNGTLNITNGGNVSSKNGSIGSNSGSTGVVTVDGSNSKWTHEYSLDVGESGNGTLNITGGGTVIVNKTTNAAYNPGSTGTINFDNGTLTTAGLAASPSQLTGTGTINTRGLVSDVDLVFNSPVSLNQTFLFKYLPNQNVTVKLDMSNPAAYGDLGAGWKGDGSLTIRDGITVYSIYGDIGHHTTATGVVTVTGTGSKWANSSYLYVGNNGKGTLDITAGGNVSNYESYIGYNSGSTGDVTVNGTNSKWTSESSLDVGRSGNGTLKITGGGNVSNSTGFIGIYSGSTGDVTVDGTNSKWINRSILYVGRSGNGTLNITGSGAVSNTNGYIGYSSGATSKVAVDGTGSMWTNSSALYVGYNGKGALNITGGCTVTGTSVSINNQSLLAIDVGNGSQLTISNGTGTITNSGTVRIMAGANVAAGIPYTPISASTWSGSGIYQPIGGTWNATAHTFTASLVQQGSAGTPLTVNLASLQRVLVIDDVKHWVLGASFAPASTSIDLTASTISGQVLTDLLALLDADQSLLGAWQITTGSSYALPAYLSFDVGPGRSRNDLTIWHYDGAAWSEFDATDLTCNGDYASFTVTGFSGYALITVPEPGTLALLIAGLLCILVYVRLKQKS